MNNRITYSRDEARAVDTLCDIGDLLQGGAVLDVFDATTMRRLHRSLLTLAKERAATTGSGSWRDERSVVRELVKEAGGYFTAMARDWATYLDRPRRGIVAVVNKHAAALGYEAQPVGARKYRVWVARP